MSQIEPSPDALTHDAFFYRGVEEYARAILSFVRKDAGPTSPTLIAVPQPKARLLRALLEGGGDDSSENLKKAK